MRSALLHFSALLGFVAFAAVATSVGCGAGQNDASFNKETDTEPVPHEQPGETAFAGPEKSTDASARRGSTLCGVTAETCMPDDEFPSSCPESEGQPNEDAAITTACRITKSTDAGSYASGCGPADRRGVDGEECHSGADCAPGFECIDGDQGAVCRRYCCAASSCIEHVSKNGGPTFCDIQKMVDHREHSAPVCMPLKKCTLLHEGDCFGTEETCALVTDKGENGCVPIGDANVGDSCDEQHCAKDLTCLGSPGDRKCFQLCRTDGADCPTNQTCTTGAVFQNPAFGVCREANSR